LALCAGVANFWHGGGLYTHYSLAWHFPEHNVALYVVVNGYGGDVKPFAVVEALSYYVADLLLGYSPWVTPSNLCTYPAPWVSANRTTVDKKVNGGYVSTDGKQGEKVRAVAGKLKEILNPQNVNIESGTQEEKVENGDQINNSGGSNNDDNNNDGNNNNNNNDGSNNNNDSNNNNNDNNDSNNNNNNDASTSNFVAFQGTYFHPLFGNFSVFLEKPEKGDLLCRIRILTGRLRPLLKPPTFGVELTGRSLRFLSKPSATTPAKNAFNVEFVKSLSGEVTAVDVHSSWAMEAPVRFQKLS
jgi:hypothetical protein